MVTTTSADDCGRYADKTEKINTLIQASNDDDDVYRRSNANACKLVSSALAGNRIATGR